MRDDRVYITNASTPLLYCVVMVMFALYQAAKMYVRCSRWVVRFNPVIFCLALAFVFFGAVGSMAQNAQPVADAGDDQTVATGAITISGDSHMGLESSSNVSPTTAPIPITVFENEQIYMAFENSIIKQVNERLDEKLARRLDRYINVAAIIIGVIVAIGGYVVRLVLDLQVKTQVKTQVREQFAQETAQFVQ